MYSKIKCLLDIFMFLETAIMQRPWSKTGRRSCPTVTALQNLDVFSFGNYKYYFRTVIILL